MARYVYECPMRWSDMDSLRHINNVQYLRFLEDARIDWLFRRGAQERRDDEGFMVVRNEIDYRRQLVYRHAPIPIELWVSRLGNGSFEVSYDLVDTADDGTRTVYAQAKSVLATVSLVDGRPRRLSEEFRGFLAQFVE